MKVFKSEKDIENLIIANKVNCDVNYLIENKNLNSVDLAKACVGNACAFSAIKDQVFKVTDDVMPISSVLVTDIWNANGDVFTAEQIVKAETTPNFKPINWMHRGSEDSQNENIGVMVKASLIYGDLPEINFMEEDLKEEYGSSFNNTLSGKVHIKQDGLIWAQYFPTYAEKVKKGISAGDLYVSMECFFEDFGYCLRKDEDDESPLLIDRKPSTAHISKDLRAYGGSGKTKYKGKTYQVGRWLKNIVFSGQGLVVEPANKRKGKILSIILKDNSFSKADIINDFDPSAANPPTAPVQEPGAILNPEEMQGDMGQPTMTSAPSELMKNVNLPKTHEIPADGLLFYSAKEAAKVGEIELGCTGYHLYQQDRHSDEPLLYAKLIADPSDLEEQMKIGQYRPCQDERELRFVLQDMAKKGLQLRRSGRLKESQQTSFQANAPGGGGNNNSLAPTQQGGPAQDTAAPGYSSPANQSLTPSSQPAASRGQNLSESEYKVYEKVGEQNMSEIKESEIEEALDLASAKIEELNKENEEYIAAIEQATAHIEKMNIEIAELNAFASAVEGIADKAYSKKIGLDRLSELKSLVGAEVADFSAEEMSNLDEKAYSALKTSIVKVSASLQKKHSEDAKIKEATKAVASIKKASATPLVLSETSANRINPAETLIGFALGKKR